MTSNVHVNLRCITKTQLARLPDVVERDWWWNVEAPQDRSHQSGEALRARAVVNGAPYRVSALRASIPFASAPKAALRAVLACVCHVRTSQIRV